MRRFEKDNLIQFVARFYTFAGKKHNLDDAAMPLITITNDMGKNVIDGASMDNHPTVGTYYYNWTSDTAGKYRVEVKGTLLRNVQLARDKFRVIETS